MTPAIRLLKKQKIIHQVYEYHHDPRQTHYGLEAANALGIEPHRIFKTLLFCLNDQERNLAVAIIPVDKRLNLKQAAKAAGAKKAEMANPELAQKITGYVLGGISPLGQKKLLPTFIHASAQELESVWVSGGKRGLDIALSPSNLAELTRAHFVSLCDE